MKRELSCILAVNRYLIRCKGDSRRVDLIRRYLKHKLAKALAAKCGKHGPGQSWFLGHLFA